MSLKNHLCLTVIAFLPATLGVTGEEIGELLYHAEIMKELAADAVLMRVSFSSAFGIRGDRQLSFIPVLLIALHLSRRLLSSIQHSDLHEALYEIAVNAGVRVEFNSNVVAVDPETPSVTLNGGKKVYGDIVIGTDGDQSLVRKLMFDEGDEEEMVKGPWTGYVWVLMSTFYGRFRCSRSSVPYSFSVPLSKMQNDEELKELCRDREYTVRRRLVELLLATC